MESQGKKQRREEEIFVCVCLQKLHIDVDVRGKLAKTLSQSLNALVKRSSWKGKIWMIIRHKELSERLWQSGGADLVQNVFSGNRKLLIRGDHDLGFLHCTLRLEHRCSVNTKWVFDP